MDSPEPGGRSTAGNAEESEWTRTVRISQNRSPGVRTGAGNKSGMREQGKLRLTLSLPSTEARRLLFRPKESEDRKIYTEMESTIFAADYEEPSGEEGFRREAEMRGPYGPRVQRLSGALCRAFEEVE